MSYIEAIQNQIDATSPILERIVCLCPVPERGPLNSGGKVCGKKRYDRVTVGLIEEDINHWQHKTRAVLAACFSDDSGYKHVYEFNSKRIEVAPYIVHCSSDIGFVPICCPNINMVSVLCQA